MSAFGVRADIKAHVPECPLIAISGHWRHFRNYRIVALRGAGRPSPVRSADGANCLHRGAKRARLAIDEERFLKALVPVESGYSRCDRANEGGGAWEAGV